MLRQSDLVINYFEIRLDNRCHSARWGVGLKIFNKAIQFFVVNRPSLYSII